jgi:hypothetical protein
VPSASSQACVCSAGYMVMTRCSGPGAEPVQEQAPVQEQESAQVPGLARVREPALALGPLRTERLTHRRE